MLPDSLPALEENPDPNGVKIFLTERVIDGSRYGEEICARSWEEAHEIAARSGSTVVGTKEEDRCARCLNLLSGSQPESTSDDWADTIDG